MDTICLKEALRPWLRVRTWHQLHSADDERFRRAVASMLKHCGYPIDRGILTKAMSELLIEHHPDKRGRYWEEKIAAFARQAEFLLAELFAGSGPTRVQ